VKNDIPRLKCRPAEEGAPLARFDSAAHTPSGTAQPAGNIVELGNAAALAVCADSHMVEMVYAQALLSEPASQHPVSLNICQCGPAAPRGHARAAAASFPTMISASSASANLLLLMIHSIHHTWHETTDQYLVRYRAC
jgi:hypothetical protein